MTIPSGNFGNALGAYYAKKMGLCVEKILISSNENNILTSWINDGVYDLSDKKLIMTKSPAMDILKSSNIERIMFDMFGALRTKELMNELASNNKFILNQKEKESLQNVFSATYSDDEYGKQTIKKYLDKGYLMDPHTATCIKAHEAIKTSNIKNVIYSTAQWTKFSPTVLNSIKQNDEEYEDKFALQIISNDYNQIVPQSINDLFNKKVIHDTIIDVNSLEEEIIKFIKLSNSH